MQLKITFSVFSLLLVIFSCAPIPMVQSARVTGLTGVSASYASPMVDVATRFNYVCTNCSTAIVRTGSEQLEHDPGRVSPRVGIGDRAELMLVVTPYLYPPFFLASGNLKIALVDYGVDHFFKNVSIALFSGGDFFPTEHDRWYSLWGGLILGTHTTSAHNDLELVFMCYGKQFLYDFAYLNINTIVYRTANFTVGLIYRPFTQQRIELHAGVTGIVPVSKRIDFSDHYYYYDMEIVGAKFTSTVESTRFRINPFVFQCGISLYLARDKQR